MTDITAHAGWPATEAAETALRAAMKNPKLGEKGQQAPTQAYVDAYNVCAAATDNPLLTMADHGY